MTQPNDPLNITDSDALLELIAKNRQGQARMIDDRHMSDFLRGRVRGQDPIVHGVSRLIRLQWGKLRRDRPIANLMFVGPPATGKTELAKTMAEYLFGDGTNMVRFDCNELSSPEAKNQLLGVPAFYKNSEMGGALTTRMAANPRQLVLFDEIEKAHPIVFDLFLSMMGEGRVTQPCNNTTIDFTQAIIVLTSNKAHKALLALSQQIKDPLDLSKAARATLREQGEFRPEIISRFDEIFIFQPLHERVQAEIAALKIVKAARQYGLELTKVAPGIVYQIISMAEKADDTRDLVRIIDIFLGESFLLAKSRGMRRIRIDSAENGQPEVALDDGN